MKIYIVFRVGCDNPHCVGYRTQKVFRTKEAAEQYVASKGVPCWYGYETDAGKKWEHSSYFEYAVEAYEIEEEEVRS